MRTRREKDHPSIYATDVLPSIPHLYKGGGDTARQLCQWPECNFESVIFISRGAMKKVALCRLHNKEFSKHPFPAEIKYQRQRRTKQRDAPGSI